MPFHPGESIEGCNKAKMLTGLQCANAEGQYLHLPHVIALPQEKLDTAGSAC